MQDINIFIGVLQDLIARFGINLMAAIAIFLIGSWVAQLTRRFVRKIVGKSRLDPTLISFLGTLVYYSIFAFALIAALNRLGVETASIIAVLGAAGLAVGLALQGSLSNFAAGVLLIVFRRFEVGDLIEAAGVFGHVEEIHPLTTAVITLDNKVVIIPNAHLTSGNLTNYSTRGKLRVDLVVSVAYDADSDQVKRVITEALRQDPHILKDPAPTVAVLDLAESSVKFAVRPWVRPEHYIPIRFSVYERVKKCLDAEGIKIPFPQRDVHIFQQN